jgi:RND family efflux transporter MFP subunit
MHMSRRIVVALLALLLAAVAIGYVAYDRLYQPAEQTSAEPELQTATVRRGELIVSATGAGEVVPVTEVALGFRSGGALAELPVAVGDAVEAGDVVARLDDAEARLQVSQAEIDLRQAMLQLSQKNEGADDAELAAARASLASAQANWETVSAPPSEDELAAARNNLLSAQQALNDLAAGPSAAETTIDVADLKLAEVNLQRAQSDYNEVAWRGDAAALSQSAALQEATIAYEKAKAAYDVTAAGTSDDQISAARAKVAEAQTKLDDLEDGSSEAEVAAAKAKLEQAEAELASLLAGASSTDLELAQLDVVQAANNLEAAQLALDDTLLTAPITGTVTAVNAQVGEMVGAETLIRIADLHQPVLEIFLDETDLDKVGVGCEVDVVFDALPDESFTGVITQVDPSLFELSGVTTVRALAELAAYAKPQPLPIGLNATVDVIGGRASNALLVPVEALREISPGQFALFVMEDGEPRLRMVEVGLMDFTFAEIISGVEEGDVVTTGIVETSEAP